MDKQKAPLLPTQRRILRELGENIKLARLRRDIPATLAAERAGISRTTLYKAENADEGVAIGVYLRILYVLGLERDLLAVARDDVLGRKLQDARLLPKKRASKRKGKNNE